MSRAADSTATARASIEAGSTRSWLALGRALHRSSGRGALSTVALALGVFALTSALLLIGVLSASYQARLERDSSRIPESWVTVPDRTTTGARWRILDDSADGQWVHIIVVIPDRHSPLPPGVAAWPEPGQVLLSPGLASTKAGDQIVARYGTRAPGTISAAGVVSPQERLAYLRPTAQQSAHMEGLPLTRYGLPWTVTPTIQGMIGGAGYQRPFIRALFEMLLAFVLPAAVLLVVAARAGSEQRDKQLQVMTVLGADTRQTRRLILGMVLPGSAWGGAASILLLGIMATVDLPVPWAVSQVLAADIRRLLWLPIVCLVVGWIISVVLAVALNAPGRARGTRPRPTARRERIWGLLPMPMACIGLVQGLLATRSWEDSPPRILLIYVGIAVIAATLPMFLGTVIGYVAHLIVAIGRRLGTASMIVGGRQILADGGSVRRLTSGMALLILLCAHAIGILAMPNSAAEEAARERSLLGAGIMALSGDADRADQKAALTAALPPGSGLIGIRFISSGPVVLRAEVHGSCAVLSSLKLPCANANLSGPQQIDDRRIRNLVKRREPRGVVTRVGAPAPDGAATDASSDSMVYVISINRQPLPVEQIRAELVRRALPAPTLRPIGEEGFVGLREIRDQGRWNIVGATIATALLGIAITVSILGDSTDHADRIGVLSMWGAGRRFSWGVVIIRVLVPLLLAVSVGSVAAQISTYVYLLQPLGEAVPASFFAATAVLPLAAGVLISLVGLRAQYRAVDRWRP